MSDYSNLVASLRKKVGPISLEEILRLQEVQSNSYIQVGAAGTVSVTRIEAGTESELSDLEDGNTLYLILEEEA